MIQAVTQTESIVADNFCRELTGDCQSLWRCDGYWRPVVNAGMPELTEILLSQSANEAIRRIVEHVAAYGQPLMQRVSERRFAWAIPVCNVSPQTIAVQIVSDDPEELAAVINRSSVTAWARELDVQQTRTQLQKQHERLQAYASQVSADLEELTWLRNLATNLELSDSGNSVEQIAENTLPSLCRLMDVGTLAFVRDVAVPGLDSQLPILWQTGRVRIPRSTCLAIIHELRGSELDRTVVRSFDTKQFADGSFSGAESCVLVPVATQSGRLGWLLAVNKDNHSANHSPGRRDALDISQFGHRTLGRFEASLMSATAVILAAHGRNCGLFHEKELLLRGVIRSMVNAIDAKDSYTCGHSDRVAEFARLIAREQALEVSLCEQIYMTGLLHDVGKIGVPDHVLKKPGQLTEQEFELIKQHPVVGYEILKHLDNLDYVLPGVLHHHEAVDGSGYPHGLKGDEIPLSARILAVADAYDAMTSNRPYRRGMPTERAEQILRDGSGRQWDADCVDAFFRTVNGIRLVASQRSTPFLGALAHPAAMNRAVANEPLAAV